MWTMLSLSSIPGFFFFSLTAEVIPRGMLPPHHPRTCDTYSLRHSCVAFFFFFFASCFVFPHLAGPFSDCVIWPAKESAFRLFRLAFRQFLLVPPAEFATAPFFSFRHRLCSLFFSFPETCWCVRDRTTSGEDTVVRFRDPIPAHLVYAFWRSPFLVPVFFSFWLRRLSTFGGLCPSRAG